MPIYVVDDDPEITRSIRFLLSTLKLECQTFANGEEFLGKQPKLSPGCVLLDMNLGGMDGMAVHAEMRDRGALWPVIYLTGQCSIPLIVRALKQGATEYLVKPSTEEELLQALANAA
jgi:FixJ family two-component response regulator